MKEINEIIDRVPTERLTDITNTLGLKRRSGRSIANSLLTPEGLHAVLSTLSQKELNILELVYRGHDGCTFGDIEKALHIPVDELDEFSRNLSNLFLVHTIKNRQLLNNKLDKLYGIKEIAEHLNFSTTDEIHQALDNIGRKLKKEHENRGKSPSLTEHESRALKSVALMGGMVTFEELHDHIPKTSFSASLKNLISTGILVPHHVISPAYNLVFILSETFIPLALSLTGSENLKKKVSVQNRYLLLNNMLHTFDTISTYGLFLTKQQEFRKIDKRRIIDAMIHMQAPDGSTVDPEITADLSLYLLNRLKCLRQQKDIATITLDPVSSLLDTPDKFLQKTLRSLNAQVEDTEYFPPPFSLPSNRELGDILNILEEILPARRGRVKIFFYNRCLCSQMKHSVTEALEKREHCERETENLLLLLTLLGIVNVESGHLVLSETADTYLHKNQQTEEEKKEVIYINPDFSLMVPVMEISPTAHYLILAHTEITREDVMLSVMINKSSVVRAHKRGMSTRRFIEYLEALTKNEIPQNLQFLLNDWSRQTIKLSINGVILLKTNNPAFIDDVLVNRSEGAVLEKISDNYAIIDREHIDEIVKLAKKEDAVVSLFGEHTVTD
jgi:hypothetical protein